MAVDWCAWIQAQRKATRTTDRDEDTPMTIYIAAPFETISAMVLLAGDLTRAGFTIRAEWLLKDPDDIELRPEDALQDLADIEACDVILVHNPRDFWSAGSGGRHVELGFALALGKPVVLFGRRSCVYHYLSGIRVVEDRDALPAALVDAAAATRPILS